MTANSSRPERQLCPSCWGEVSVGGPICPTCGAVLLIEGTVQDMKATATRQVEDVVKRIRQKPAYWVAWCMALIPFFVVPPLLACALVVSEGHQGRWNTTILTVAAVNIILSVYFWVSAGDYVMAAIADMPGWLRVMGIPKATGLLDV